MNPKLFPTVMMALNWCAAAVYFSRGDWKKGVYWLSASVLTYTVTY
jgi:hypothetical protein